MIHTYITKHIQVWGLRGIFIYQKLWFIIYALLTILHHRPPFPPLQKKKKKKDDRSI